MFKKLLDLWGPPVQTSIADRNDKNDKNDIDDIDDVGENDLPQSGEGDIDPFAPR